MPKQVCGNRPCNALVDLPHRYCPSCVEAGAGRDKRPSASTRLYGREWRRQSAAYLAENPIAVDIFKEHKGVGQPAEVVDHIVPHRGDLFLFWNVDNWQGLTKSDHSRKTALEDGGFGRARTSKRA